MPIATCSVLQQMPRGVLDADPKDTKAANRNNSSAAGWETYLPDARPPEARAGQSRLDHRPDPVVVVYVPTVATCEVWTGLVEAGEMAHMEDAPLSEARAGQVRADDGPETVVTHEPTVATCEATTGLVVE